MSSPGLPHVCLPINLDAFVLNEKVCSEGDIRIAPITVPDYASLRLDSAQVQHDILPRIDLHGTQPASSNPRVSTMYEDPFVDAGSVQVTPANQTGTIKKSRLGVYIHWSVPRGYRSAQATASPAPPQNRSSPSKTPSSWQPKPAPGDQNPTYPLVPNRWLLIRILHSYKLPDEAKNSNITPPTVAAWIIESDRLRGIDEIDTFNDKLVPSNDPKDDGNQLPIDLESEVTPFVAFNESSLSDVDHPDILSSQSDKYLGYKVPLARWSEKNLSYPQRIKLTTMNSSNPLFADYSLHNPNVFSTNDNFFYGFDNNQNPLFLQAATCDYVVAGWHSSAGDDPLGVFPADGSAVSLTTRLKKLFCTSPSAIDPKNDPSDKSDKTRLICHGAKYTVVYNQDRPNTPADDTARRFKPVGTDPAKLDFGMEPIAVGTSPLDAVLAFFSAHQDGNGNPDTFEKTVMEPKKPDGSVADPTVAKTLMDVRELLYSSGDDYDSRTKASDLIFSHNYGRSPGGFIWKYDKTKENENAPAMPSITEQTQLRLLNDYQHAYDAAGLKLDQLRWALFAEFFKYVSDPTSTAHKSDLAAQRKDMYSSRVKAMVPEARTLIQQMDQLQKLGIDRVVSVLNDANVKKVARDPFFRRKDPNLCIAGIDAGWDNAYLSNTPTRFATQLKSPVTGPNSGSSTDISGLLSTISGKDFGPDNALVKQTVAALIQEASNGIQLEKDTKSGRLAPLLGFKTWEGQPFCPQFIEWEASYYHIPWEYWDVENTYSAIASVQHPYVGYGNTTDLSKLAVDWLGSSADSRHITGRMLVLPQPSFSFGAVVAQVLDAATPDQLPTQLATKGQRDAFVAQIMTMPFISGELAGITDALLTMANGQHLKPLVRPNGAEPIVMGVAATRGSEIGFDVGAKDMAIIGGETGRTPYGTMVDFATESLPFKGVQHGQLAITSLHLVDKFGQVIALPVPRAQTVDTLSTSEVVSNYVHPCLSEQLIPSVMMNGDSNSAIPVVDANGHRILNTIFNPSVTLDHVEAQGVPMTPFIQLTPSINQEARINMDFLVPSPSGQEWLPSAEWDNPIFGWVIVNYADSSLQFFTGDGIFYTALQFGGPKGVTEKPLYRPFDPDAGNKVSPQLERLLKHLDPAYLKALSDVIVAATPSMPFPPSEYAAYASAIIGKPLALVNVGLSLELSQPPWWAQHTIPEPRGDPSPGVPDPLRVDAEETMSDYKFKVKLGDAERPFDGLVAYWDWDPSKGDNNWEDMWTYFPDPQTEDKDCRKLISPDSFPTLSPRFIDPSPSLTSYKYKDDSETTSYTAAAMDQAKMRVHTMLIDPYTAIHVYPSILPIKSIKLASWTIQQALKNMTAFFTVGPILLTKDVPKAYDTSKVLHADSWLDAKSAIGSDPLAQPPINLPIAGGKGEWNWLQPYVVHDPQDSAHPSTTKYNALAVGVEDGYMRHDPAPYTFVEGYLQLARPLDAPNVPAS